MNRKIIKDIDELTMIIEYFNSFHDGFLKSIKVFSGNKFGQNPSWEKPEKYESNEEKLRDTGLWLNEKTGMFLEIHHYNYDWPNKLPDNRIILYLKNIKKIDPDIIQVIGLSIYDCEATSQESSLGLIFTFEAFINNKCERIELKPLEFEKISIQEKSYQHNQF